MASLMNKTNNQEIAINVKEAKNFFARTKGLLGLKELEQGHSLWIHSCRSIHTFFMQFSIDAIFVDKNLVVKAVYKNLKPWRMTLIHPTATSVFELNAGVIKDNVSIGDQLYVGA